ncbi:MAG: T9SS type A sorting domain-containing protein [Ignavibacteriae bacterium]|nr:T9SS type A sorting domain-containing protein [Ignavibacteriota bacterium]
MKKFILLLITIPIIINAQYSWNNSRPSAYPLNDIFFIDSLIGWSVGQNSTCLKTTNGGDSWVPLNMPVYSNLQKVSFIDENIGWIVGDGLDSPILKTIDGGNSWTNYSPVDYGWTDLYVVSENVLFVTGIQGVYKSTNGGINWSNKIHTSGWASTIFFIDSLNGWFGNTIGEIYKTSNGGESWKLVHYMKFIWHRKISFVNNQIGFLVSAGLYSNEGRIYKTIDGGESWKLQDSVVGQKYKDLVVIDSLNAIALGSNNLFRYTNDGGKIWFGENITCEAFNGISICAEKFWIVGEENHHGKIFYGTINHWKEISKSFTNSTITDIDFCDENNGLIVGSNGLILMTSDNGINWNKLDLFSFDISSVSYPNEKNVYLTGINGEFVRSIDAGNSWQITYPFQKYSNKELKFVSSQIGFAFEDYSNLLKTTDGGLNWETITELYTYDSEILDSMNLWLLDNPLETDITIVHHSSDGGKTWESNELEFYVKDIQFINANIGWIVNENDLYKTNNSGLTWEIVNENIEFQIKQLLFIDEKIGFLLGDFITGPASIKYTKDGGLTFNNIIDFSNINELRASENKIWGFDDLGRLLEIDIDKITDIKVTSKLTHANVRLEQNYPNPFNPTTTIEYSLPKSSHIKLVIYNSIGELVKILINETQNMGNYKYKFDGSDLSSGIYFYSLISSNNVITKKLLILK